MNKLFSFVIFLNFYGLVFSQKDHVVYEYEVNYNLGKPLYKTGYLFDVDEIVRYNTTKSEYIKSFKRFAIDEETSRPTINFMAAGDGSENAILFKEKDSLYSSRSLGNEVLRIIEKKKTQEWELTGNRMDLNGFNCIELKTKFRGRTYLAYVDLSIPFKYGPWKFNNLPGLAIKIVDLENKMKWTLKSISKRSAETVNEFVKKQDDYLASLRSVSLREYVRLYDKTKGGSEVLFSKMPREYKRDNSQSSKFKRGGFELEYEWEEN